MIAAKDTATLDETAPDETALDETAAPVFSAKLISPKTIGGYDEAAPILYRSFVAKKPIASARLYSTAHGVYVASLNGSAVSDEVLAPGWTSYHHRLLYQTVDVTPLVQEGENRIEFLVGDGWFRGSLGLPVRRGRWGDRLAVFAQLELSYADGELEIIVSDDSWLARDSQVWRNGLYPGQSTDLSGSRPVREDGVEVVEFDPAVLQLPDGPPVRRIEERPAESISRLDAGRLLIDFGQNLVGWVRIEVSGQAAGTLVRVRHAEVLENGELGTRPLRTADATDEYVLAGGAHETLEPELTFHGFRYAEVSGLAELRPEDVTAVVISSDLRRIGWFESSNALVNKLHENTVWGMKGNFVSIPTDCPQRDERLGWTGDIQVFSPTASYLYDTYGFLSSWLRDLAIDQKPDGSVPYVIPDTYNRDAPAAAAWSDAAVIVPWVLYERFGDATVLRRQYGSMRAWVERVEQLAGPDRVWSGGFQYGDWLDPTAPPDTPGAPITSKDLVASAHFARSTDLLARAARVLGFDDDADRFAALNAQVVAAFNREFVTGSGRLTSDTQTAYALALEWDLIADPAVRAAAGERLLDRVRLNNFTIGTGFVGTPLILDALTNAGHLDAAYRMLLQTECPSWLYQVAMGATTIWERWDSMLPDGSVNPGWMTSFNHYAYGAVADWIHRTVAGLAPAAPGYVRTRIAPRPGGGITSASAEHITPFGTVSVAWSITDGSLTVTVDAPSAIELEVSLPSGEEFTASGGRYTWTAALPTTARRTNDDPTTREAIDDEALWNRILDAAQTIRPDWAGRDVAKAAEPYLDLPVLTIAPSIAKSFRTDDEAAYEAAITAAVRATRSEN